MTPLTFLPSSDPEATTARNMSPKNATVKPCQQMLLIAQTDNGFITCNTNSLLQYTISTLQYISEVFDSTKQFIKNSVYLLHILTLSKNLTQNSVLKMYKKTLF
jgi:hypothetical protein